MRNETDSNSGQGVRDLTQQQAYSSQRNTTQHNIINHNTMLVCFKLITSWKHTIQFSLAQHSTTHLISLLSTQYDAQHNTAFKTCQERWWWWWWCPLEIITSQEYS